MTISETLNNNMREWHTIKEQLAALTAQEKELRLSIFEEAFPNPTEGSKENKLDVGDGFILQGDYKIGRRIDETVLASVRSVVAPEVFDKVIEYKPKLKKAAFMSLTGDDALEFSKCIVEKPGTPSLEIKQPKRK